MKRIPFDRFSDKRFYLSLIHICLDLIKQTMIIPLKDFPRNLFFYLFSLSYCYLCLSLIHILSSPGFAVISSYNQSYIGWESIDERYKRTSVFHQTTTGICICDISHLLCRNIQKCRQLCSVRLCRCV